MTPWLAMAPTFVALVALVTAAAADVIAFEIPNTLSVVVATAAIAHHLIHPGVVWWSYAVAPVLMFLFGLLAFSRGWLGGGDVKLMTAVTMWTGLAGLPVFFLATSLAGGLLLLLLFALRWSWSASGRAVPPKFDVLRPNGPIPYAVAVAAGAIWWAATSAGSASI